MWLKSNVHKEDLEIVSNNTCIEWNRFQDKTIFVTGATGLIGQSLISTILYSCQTHKISVKVIALVRNLEKAEKIFSEILCNYDNLIFVVGDVCDFFNCKDKIDFIIHGASVTDSQSFIDYPVETIFTTIQGTKNVLELAKTNHVESMVYMSSMEVYGTPSEKKLLTEFDLGLLDILSVRSCYPESKRMAENLCVCYASEYFVDVKIARLAQTFGPGVPKDDKRVFAHFIRSVQNGKDIILQTDGSSARMYLYTMDAVSALLTILLKGKKAEAYNVANKETYLSIREMGELVIELISRDDIPSLKVKTIQNKDLYKYPPNSFLFLDTSKIESLGWNAVVSLKNMYLRMMSAI